MTGGVSADRRRAMLRTAMGPAIAEALADPRVIEIMVNPDGGAAPGQARRGSNRHRGSYGGRAGRAIIRLVASHARAEVHGDAPIVSAELPPHVEGRAGERFEGRAAPRVDRAVLLDPQACGTALQPRRLCDRWHHDAGGRRSSESLRHAALQYPGRGRHQLGQDHARQRPCSRRWPGSTSASS